MRYRKHLRTLGVVVVTGVAAIGSYSHMRALALEHGQGEFLASILPLSVDGLLAVASIVLSEDREANRPASGWARASFVLGVAASIAANVEAAQEDPISRLISAWPAVALLFVVEMLVGKRKPVSAIADTAVSATADTVTEVTKINTLEDGVTTVTVPKASPLVAPLPQDAGNVPAVWITGGQSSAERVRLSAARLPQSATLAEIAAAAKCSERTAGRYLPDDHPAKPGKSKPAESPNGRSVVKTPAT